MYHNLYTGVKEKVEELVKMSRAEDQLWYEASMVSVETTPEGRLAAAMLRRAYLDLWSKADDCVRLSARQWLYQRSSHPYSFQSCCELLHRHPEQTRKWIVSKRPVCRCGP